MLELVDDEFSIEPSEKLQSVLVEKMKDVEFTLLKIGEWKEVEGRLFHLSEGNFMLPFLCRRRLLSKCVDLEVDLALCRVERPKQGGIDFLEPVAK